MDSNDPTAWHGMARHICWRRVSLPLAAVGCSLKDYERERWVLQSWQDVFGALVQGQLQNLFLSVAHQLLVATQLVTEAGGGAEGSSNWPGGGAAAGPVTSAAATVESSAPFASPSRCGCQQGISPPACILVE